ncbi:MAG: hypothetical protein V2B20_00060 [Pseudomonadota bacterium]
MMTREFSLFFSVAQLLHNSEIRKKTFSSSAIREHSLKQGQQIENVSILDLYFIKIFELSKPQQTELYHLTGYFSEYHS